MEYGIRTEYEIHVEYKYVLNTKYKYKYNSCIQIYIEYKIQNTNTIPRCGYMMNCPLLIVKQFGF